MVKNWTKIYKKYKGLWVALSKDEETVLGAGKTLKVALEKAREKSNEKPIVARIPQNLAPFVGSL